MVDPQPDNGRLAALFAGGGDMAARIMAHDWSTSPLGPPEGWSDALLSAVSLLLPASAEIVLFWGDEQVALYNDAYAPTIGTKHPGALGRPARESWTELWDDLEPLLRHVRETGETYSAKDRPFYIERAGYGEEVYFDISYSPVRTADGTVGGVLCIVAETTTRVRAARQMAEERARLAEMFDQAPSFMAVLRQPGHVFELVNASVQQLVGGRDLIGLTVPEALPELVSQNFVALLDNVVASGEAYRGDNVPVRLWRGEHAPDEQRFVDFIYQPVRDLNGTITGVFVEGTDVTDRKRQADELRESEERFRTLADSLPALVWINDAEGRFLFASRGFETLLGLTPETMLAEGWRRVVHRDDMAAFVEFGRRRLSEPRSFSRDIRLCDADGNVRWFHVEGRPRRWGAQFEGFVGCGVDVTDAHIAGEALERRVAERTAELTEQISERERVEATLAQMQRLEAVGQLTSGVAHDFNNLLTVVLGNLALIERTIDRAGIDGKTRQRLEHVRAAAERGARLTGQLLAFSRRQRLEARAVSLNEIVANMRDLLQSTLGGAVAVETELGQDVWPALVDPTQIELIILNLAINARDAMEGGGTLRVATRNVMLGDPERSEEPSAGDYVAVSVIDTGSGMTEEIRNKVFEPFFTTKEVGKGSGLGLAQVYGFAKQSGGGVRIDTAPGAGTTVSVYLPRAEALEDARDQAPAATPRGGSIAGRTILVLDDDDGVRNVTADELREAGCRVIEAADGAAALEALAAEDVAAVVADFAMPGMNGAQFAEEARRRYPALPVLFVTGYADLAALAHVPEDQVLQKPYPSGAVSDRLRAILDTGN
ncbi:PAS domain S-box protein [Sphingomonas sp. TZW2008]|uniref:PAS domain S-box protein n=1 Tax=Sphingomonas sp. TZW2008 TaxID=1917973 RepID=UPI0015C516E3|nr:PAS domain S-box protein [Sphingomonas sp. TZW2008]